MPHAAPAPPRPTPWTHLTASRSAVRTLGTHTLTRTLSAPPPSLRCPCRPLYSVARALITHHAWTPPARQCQLAPNGKELLKGVSLGMYLGAKIGVLGANGAGEGLRGPG